MTMTPTSWPDPVGAFVPHGKLSRPPVRPGTLSGLRIAVKDLFDWAGVPTGAGNPDWLTTHPVPDRDAEVLTGLGEAGATLYGKTVTDELAYSIQGDNVHYGTPVNTAAPDRVPGGSSSGSAAAVAAGLTDAALGTDTGGSVRVPAAYCGLFGLRTTHGAVSVRGQVPLAPRFDTVGWFAADPGTLSRLTESLVPPPREPHWRRAWFLPEADALTDGARDPRTSLTDRLGIPLLPLEGLTEVFGGLEGLRKIYVTVQGFEAWQTHGTWITGHRPTFGPAIAARFAAASQIGAAEAAEALAALERFRALLRSALGTDGLLVLPSAAGPAPRVTEDPAVVDAVRTLTMRLTCPAGLAGLPQLTVPWRGPDGLPRGLGLVGPAGSDAALCRLAAGREA